ncbi:hypothetical protein [Rickettsiales endosymbiont of Stachyamoeba lipophora]|uniref:hypothetical protein n=1 Tax=Rickettsiales endosymbiont of Stachyamoeba lipophora TaxID=2486578 RepID=UPI000F6498C4|nr:hypothetical protein [Rickettsiales endosymbiont of Stachyamoeba lipophora]AZL15220.1 hypothetical protein EF513_01420 [Rickettsiales endosymbiont of Stachyamoeba lipophora]
MSRANIVRIFALIAFLIVSYSLVWIGFTYLLTKEITDYAIKHDIGFSEIKKGGFPFKVKIEITRPNIPLAVKQQGIAKIKSDESIILDTNLLLSKINYFLPTHLTYVTANGNEYNINTTNSFIGITFSRSLIINYLVNRKDFKTQEFYQLYLANLHLDLAHIKIYEGGIEDKNLLTEVNGLLLNYQQTTNIKLPDNSEEFVSIGKVNSTLKKLDFFNQHKDFLTSKLNLDILLNNQQKTALDINNSYIEIAGIKIGIKGIYYFNTKNGEMDLNYQLTLTNPEILKEKLTTRLGFTREQIERFLTDTASEVITETKEDDQSIVQKEISYHFIIKNHEVSVGKLNMQQILALMLPFIISEQILKLK